LTLHGVEHLERKIVATGSEFANRSADQVVGNDRGDRGSKSGSGGNQSF